MALVYRDDRAYYYRSVRQGGRPTTEYVAAGELAVAMAFLDHRDRERRRGEAEAEHQELNRQRAEAEGDERPLINYHQAVEAEMRAALQVAGYHLHHRSEWRKRRAK